MSKVYTSLLNKEKILSLSHKISLFGGLTDEQLDLVLDHCRGAKYSAEEVIYLQDSNPTYIYIVIQGRIKLLRNFPSGSLEMGSPGQGHSFGEASLIGIESHGATAVAGEESELLVLSGETLRTLWHKDKSLYAMLMMNIARELGKRLHKAESTLFHYVPHSLKGDSLGINME